MPARKWKDSLDYNEIHSVAMTRLMKEFDPNKTHGTGGIWLSLRKECAETLVKQLVIFKISLSEGSASNVRKSARVVPIFKRGSKEVVLNYGLVKLTRITCRLREKVVRNQIEFLIDTSYLSGRKYGFRMKSSCDVSI